VLQTAGNASGTRRSRRTAHSGRHSCPATCSWASASRSRSSRLSIARTRRWSHRREAGLRVGADQHDASRIGGATRRWRSASTVAFTHTGARFLKSGHSQAGRGRQVASSARLLGARRHQRRVGRRVLQCSCEGREVSAESLTTRRVIPLPQLSREYPSVLELVGATPIVRLDQAHAARRRAGGSQSSST